MLGTRGKAYPQELRGRVLVAHDEGGRVGQIARPFKVSVHTCRRSLAAARRAARPPPGDCQEFRVGGGMRSLIRPVLW